MIDFLDHLYRHCDGGWVSLLTLDRTTGEKTVRWTPVDAIDLDIPPHACIWFGAATRTEPLGNGRRGGATDCQQIPALWLDVDIASPVHAADDLPADIDQALTLIADYPLRPTAIVDSGNGLQAWWQLDEPLDATDATRVLADWGTTWNALGHRRGWHVDNVFDIARVMRLPGTSNHKTNPAKNVEVIDVDWTRTYGLDQIEQHTLDAPTPPQPATRRGVPYIGPERPGDAYDAVTDAATILEAHGFVLDHTDRNGHRHYRAPHRSDQKGATGATAYDDGHAAIWSETFARAHGLDVRVGYRPFQLLTMLDHGGDFTAAARALKADGYGSDDWDDIDGYTMTATEPAPLPDGPWPAPVPLTANKAELPTFPTHVFPDWIAEQAHSIADELQMPVDLPANLALACLACLAARSTKVAVLGRWTEPLNLYLAVAMPPSAGKSPAFTNMMRPVAQLEERLTEQSAQTLPFLIQKRRMLEKAMTKAENAGDEAEAFHLLSQLEELDDAVAPRLTADDITPEALTILLAQQKGRLAILSTEGGLFDMMTGRYSDKANLDVYLKAWGGDTITVDRVGRGPANVKAPALTIGLTVQPSVIAALADKPELAGRGLTARFMYAMPVDNVGHRNFLDDVDVDPVIADAYDHGMHRIADRMATGDDRTDRLTLDDEARATFKQWKQQLEGQRRIDGDLRPLAEWSTKLESSTIRVAGLLHIAHGGTTTGTIDAHTMSLAIEVGDYWLAHAIAVHDLWGRDVELDKARILLDWMQGRESFTVREVWLAHRARFPRTDDIITPLTILWERGWVRTPDGSWPPARGRGKDGVTIDIHPDAVARVARVKPTLEGSDLGSVARHARVARKRQKEESLTHSLQNSEDARPCAQHAHDAQLAATGTDQSYPQSQPDPAPQPDVPDLF